MFKVTINVNKIKNVVTVILTNSFVMIEKQKSPLL